MFFYSYLSLILIEKNSLLKKDLIIKGALMGLIFSLKPHYLIFIALVEIYLVIKSRNFLCFFEIDKLIFTLFFSKRLRVSRNVFSPKSYEWLLANETALKYFASKGSTLGCALNV